MKSPNLRHSQPFGRTKDREELACCGLAHPLPEAGGKVEAGARLERGKLIPRERRLPVSNQRLPEILDG